MMIFEPSLLSFPSTETCITDYCLKALNTLRGFEINIEIGLIYIKAHTFIVCVPLEIAF